MYLYYINIEIYDAICEDLQIDGVWCTCWLMSSELKMLIQI